MINLLPEEIKKKRKRQKYKKISIISILVILLVLIVTRGYIDNLANKYQYQIKKLDSKLGEIKSNQSILAKQVMKQNELAKKNNLLNNLKDEVKYSWVVKDLNLIIPKQVWLTKLILEDETDLLLEGRTITNQKLLETVSRLEKYPYFKEIKIASNQRKNNNLNFIIKGRVKR